LVSQLREHLLLCSSYLPLGVPNGLLLTSHHTPSPPTEYGIDSQESETIIIDGPDKPFPAPPAGGKRKRGALAKDELQALTYMTKVVKDIAQAIRENKPTDVHPDLYKAIMDVLDYSPNALMVALNHLVNHKS
jgi:hypothetical protein